MERYNRDSLELVVDAREEVILTGLLKATAEGEADIEHLRQKLSLDPEFEPYIMFKNLQKNPLHTQYLTAADIAHWLDRQFYKTSVLREQDVYRIFNLYGDNGAVKYEHFLKLTLPKEDKALRSHTMTRKTSIDMISRDSGYHFIRLLECEHALREEHILRLKRLHEYQWREDRAHITQRTFTYLQSHSAVPGVSHVSVLGVCRLLSDTKQVLDVLDVERIFHRINSSGTEMLSYAEWERFLSDAEVSAYLNELYIKLFTTCCPKCGCFAQRDGGACNNVTCAICGMTFVCKTDADEDPEEVEKAYEGELDRRSGYRSPSPESPKAQAIADASSKHFGNDSRITRQYSARTNVSTYAASPAHSPARSTRSTYTMRSSSPARATTNTYSPNRFASPSSPSHSPLRSEQHSPARSARGVPDTTRPSFDRFSPPARKSSPLKSGNQNMNASFATTRASTGFGDDDISPITSRSAASRGSASSPRISGGPLDASGRNSPSVKSRGSVSGTSRNRYSADAYASVSASGSGNSDNDFRKTASPRGKSHMTKYERQKKAAALVVDTMLQQLDLDVLQEAEKEALWESGIDPDTVFTFLDRYSKNFIADTDVWQVMHSADSPGPVAFSGVCAVFRDLKGMGAKKSGQIDLQELVNLMFPLCCEEIKQIAYEANPETGLKDDEMRNILYLCRNTLACPGCEMRCQRTHEGCPSITCPVCRTSFRCNQFGTEGSKDSNSKLNYHGKVAIKKFLKFSIETAEEHEKLRKELACNGYENESLSSTLLDAFLMITDDCGFMGYHDFKRCLLDVKALKMVEVDLLWNRYSRGADKIPFVRFAHQLRPFGSC